MAAGDCNSLALARSGEMWNWGMNWGQDVGRGVCSHESQELQPKMVEGLPPGASIRRIAAGGHTVACARADGTTLCWGKFSTERDEWLWAQYNE